MLPASGNKSLTLCCFDFSILAEQEARSLELYRQALAAPQAAKEQPEATPQGGKQPTQNSICYQLPLLPANDQ